MKVYRTVKDPECIGRLAEPQLLGLIEAIKTGSYALEDGRRLSYKTACLNSREAYKNNEIDEYKKQKEQYMPTVLLGYTDSGAGRKLEEAHDLELTGYMQIDLDGFQGAKIDAVFNRLIEGIKGSEFWSSAVGLAFISWSGAGIAIICRYKIDDLNWVLDKDNLLKYHKGVKNAFIKRFKIDFGGLLNEGGKLDAGSSEVGRLRGLGYHPDCYENIAVESDCPFINAEEEEHRAYRASAIEYQTCGQELIDGVLERIGKPLENYSRADHVEQFMPWAYAIVDDGLENTGQLASWAVSLLERICYLRGYEVKKTEQKIKDVIASVSRAGRQVYKKKLVNALREISEFYGFLDSELLGLFQLEYDGARKERVRNMFSGTLVNFDTPELPLWTEIFFDNKIEHEIKTHGVGIMESGQDSVRCLLGDSFRFEFPDPYELVQVFNEKKQEYISSKIPKDIHNWITECVPLLGKIFYRSSEGGELKWRGLNDPSRGYYNGGVVVDDIIIDKLVYELDSIYTSNNKKRSGSEHSCIKRLLLNAIGMGARGHIKTYNEIFNVLGRWGRSERGHIRKLAEALEKGLAERYIESIKEAWAGKSITDVLECMLATWLAGSIRLEYNTLELKAPVPLESLKSEYILYILGEQGTGKTEFFRRLFSGDGINGERYRLLFNNRAEPVHVKANIFQVNNENEAYLLKGALINHRVVLDDDISGYYGSNSLSLLKSLSSQSRIQRRLLYNKEERSYYRRALLAATGNNLEFSADRTGERRRLVIELSKEIDFEKYNSIDKLELMVEVYQRTDIIQSTLPVRMRACEGELIKADLPKELANKLFAEVIKNNHKKTDLESWLVEQYEVIPNAGQVREVWLNVKDIKHLYKEYLETEDVIDKRAGMSVDQFCKVIEQLYGKQARKDGHIDIDKKIYYRSKYSKVYYAGLRLRSDEPEPEPEKETYEIINQTKIDTSKSDIQSETISEADIKLELSSKHLNNIYIDMQAVDTKEIEIAEPLPEEDPAWLDKNKVYTDLEYLLWEMHECKYLVPLDCKRYFSKNVIAHYRNYRHLLGADEAGLNKLEKKARQYLIKFQEELPSIFEQVRACF